MKCAVTPACFECFNLVGDFEAAAVLMPCCALCDSSLVTSLVVVLVTRCRDLCESLPTVADADAFCHCATVATKRVHVSQCFARRLVEILLGMCCRLLHTYYSVDNY